MKKPLRYGYTTGSCAAAAAKGAALMLKEQKCFDSVEITLPKGDKASFTLRGQQYDLHKASCLVVKDAGDDPDITNGAEISAVVTMLKDGQKVIIEGGTGIGRVTRPGLAVPVGEFAINPVPRRMIETSVCEVFPPDSSPFSVHVTISVPDGEERAKKTLNSRLGIIGGLSILGTTGIVNPISAQAWTDTIDTAINVALASGCMTIVLSTGRTSEMTAQKYFGIRDRGYGIRETAPLQIRGDREGLTEESYIMMGDHVGYAVRSSALKGVREIVLACQFAKLLKIACGHEQTHVSSSELDLTTLSEWLRAGPRISNLEALCIRANTARQILEQSGDNASLISLVSHRAKSFVQALAPEIDIKVLLAGYDSKVIYFA